MEARSQLRHRPTEIGLYHLAGFIQESIKGTPRRAGDNKNSVQTAFDPLVAEWFTTRFGHPTEPKITGWREIRTHRTSLQAVGVACYMAGTPRKRLWWTRRRSNPRLLGFNQPLLRLSYLSENGAGREPSKARYAGRSWYGLMCYQMCNGAHVAAENPMHAKSVGAGGFQPPRCKMFAMKPRGVFDNPLRRRPAYTLWKDAMLATSSFRLPFK